MRQSKINKEIKQLASAVGRALRQAAKAARVNDLETEHRRGYRRKAVKRSEFGDWKAKQV